MEGTDELTPTLVSDLRAGRDSAGGLLHELYHRRLQRYCRSMVGAEQEAMGAVRDVLRRVLESQVVPDELQAWIFRIARNHCLDLLRRLGQHAEGEPVPSVFCLAADCTIPLSRLVRAEQGQRFTTSLHQLPAEQQELLHLRYAEDLSRAEIAEVLGWGESIVESRLLETVTRLRDEWAGGAGAPGTPSSLPRQGEGRGSPE